MIGAGAIFVKSEQVRVFSSSKEEAVAVGGGGKLIAVSVVNGWRAKGIILVTLNHVAARVEKLGDAPFMILLVIVSPCRVKRGIVAHQDLIDPFAVKVLRRIAQIG